MKGIIFNLLKIFVNLDQLDMRPLVYLYHDDIACLSSNTLPQNR
jgi:hypothetical protein